MIELAQLQDGQLVYGLYEEVEAYAEKEDLSLIHISEPTRPY